MTRATEGVGRARRPRNIPPPSALTIEEASAALGTMLAGREQAPPIGELRALVWDRMGLSSVTARLVRAIEDAVAAAKRTRDPVAHAVADAVASVVSVAKKGVHHG